MIVLPPVRLKLIGGEHSSPVEFDWMLPAEMIWPVPDTWIALHAVGSRASIPNGNARSCRLVATAYAPTGQTARPMIPPKMEGRFASIWTSMKPGIPAYRPWIAGMKMLTTSSAAASSYPFACAILLAAVRASDVDVSTNRAPARAAASAAFCWSRRSRSIIPTSNASAAMIRSVDEPTGEQNEHLPALGCELILGPSC